MYPKKKLRSSLFLSGSGTLAFLFSLYLIQKNSPEEKFARFSDSYLQSAYENDSLSLHFTLTDLPHSGSIRLSAACPAMTVKPILPKAKLCKSSAGHFPVYHLHTCLPIHRKPMKS